MALMSLLGDYKHIYIGFIKEREVILLRLLTDIVVSLNLNGH